MIKLCMFAKIELNYIVHLLVDVLSSCPVQVAGA